MTAYEMAMQSEGFIADLRQRVDDLDKELALIRQRCETAKKHGLGHNILAKELLMGLLPKVEKLQGVVSRAAWNIDAVQP